MLEDLNQLIKLQHIDNKLMEIEAEKGDLPEQIDNLKQSIDNIKSKIADAEQKISEIEEQKRYQERQVEGAHEQLKKSQGVLYSVKTTREYDAISSEIEQAKYSMAEGERQIIELMSREEDLQAAIDESRDHLSAIESEYLERQSEMLEKLESSQDEELKLNHEREKTVVRMKKPVYAHYERIRKIRDGVGVSHLADGACSYCFSMVPPQRQVEVKRMDELILCEVCGCILVAEEGSTVR